MQKPNEVKCSKCKEPKVQNEENFSRDKRKLKGYSTICKSCVAEYQAAFREARRRNKQLYS